MKVYNTEQIRNVGLFGHGGSGKTSLVEAMMFNAGLIDRIGKVDDGNTLSDYDAEEIKRKVSIYLAMAPFEWKNYKVNVLDTPGFMDFVGEVKSALRVVESGVLCVSAVSGIEVGLEKVWEDLEDKNLPAMFYCSKMDKENANYYKVVSDLAEKFSSAVVPLYLPLGAEAEFKGLVDVVNAKAYTFVQGKPQESEVPAELQAQVKEFQDKLMEKVAESDDALMEKFFAGESFTPQEINQGLKNAVKKRLLFPVVCGSAVKNIGISILQDLILEYLPSPTFNAEITGKDPRNNNEISRKAEAGEKFAALVFKTTADPYVGKLSFLKIFSGTLRHDCLVANPNRGKDEKITGLFIMRGKNQETVTEGACGDIITVAKLQATITGDTLCDKDFPIILDGIDYPEPLMSMAVFPKSKGDEDKLSGGLARLAEEDPTFRYSRNTETKETVISGIGDLHLDIMMDRLKRKFGVEVTLASPKVPYKETIRSSTKVEGKHKKQSGGRGQYGHCWLELKPLERGKTFEFIDKIVGGAIPKNYIPSVEKGVRSAMEDGALAGYQMVDISVMVYDGSYHEVDSSDIAFQLAGRKAMREGVLKASPILLEPIQQVEILIPESFMGDIIGDINGKRGRILGMEPASKNRQLVKALVPLGEMLRYPLDLRSMTQGRGSFKMSYDHYEEVPAQVAEVIIANAKVEKEED